MARSGWNRGRGAHDEDDSNHGGAGQDGGYFGTASNGDSTQGADLGLGGGGGGGAGGTGGGAILLRASVRIDIHGQVLAKGSKGGAGADGSPGDVCDHVGDASAGGDGGAGAAASAASTGTVSNGGEGDCGTFGDHAGDCSGAGGRGGPGGDGAGGGILLQAPIVGLGGRVDNSGGSSIENGGTVKILGRSGNAWNASLWYTSRWIGGGILLRAPLLTMTGTINNAGGSSTNNGGTVKIYSLCGGQRVTGQISTGRLVGQAILMRGSAN